MTSYFYLFIPKRSGESVELNSVSVSWVYKDVNNELELAQGSLNDAAAATENQHVTIVLPGEVVLFLMAEVPGKNIQRIQQAIPYVLEDSVIDDVDGLHFAISKTNSEPSDIQYNVSVINKEYFESIITQLEESGIHADAMVADYMMLDANNTLFFDGTRVLFNSASLKFTSAMDSTINLADEDVLNLISCDKEKDSHSCIDELIKNADVQRQRCDDHPFLCLVRNRTNDGVINLLQGSYKKKKNWSKTGETWLPIAVMFLVWLIVQGGLFVFNYISLSKQNTLLSTEITKIYKKTFPESRRIIDAKAQMQQKLVSLKKRKGQSGRSFSEMLSASAGIFSKTKGLVIKSLRYYDGRINIEMKISSLQALDKLKEKLNKEKGYQVEIQNASSGKEIVTARIQIVGAEI